MPTDHRPDDGSSPLRVAGLHIYPVKSCAGIGLPSARLVATGLAAPGLAAAGLAADRDWMLVDDAGRFVSQRELPRLVLVTVALQADGGLALSAPGMPGLRVPLPTAQAQRYPVQVWDDRLSAYSAGPEAAAWFSQYLGQPLRLVRFDATQQRLSNPDWTGDIAAPNAFSDGYPILVTSLASLAELNRRLAAQGKAPVSMARFRPNLVIDGVDAHAEDWLDELHFDTPQGAVVLRLVKPCPRCPVPNIDPATAQRGNEPGDTLASYRADARLNGAISFGMNAVIVQGLGCELAVGQAGRGSVRF